MVDKDLDLDLNFSPEGLTFSSFEDFGIIWNELTKSDHTVVLGDAWDRIEIPTNEENVGNLPSGSGIQSPSNEFEADNIGSVEVDPVSTVYNQQVFPETLDVQLAPSSLPASETWPGEYEFTVSFNPQTKTTKGVAWTYSKIKDKLYVGKDSPCPINFSVNTVLPNGLWIRVMALYTSPEQVSEIVQRCINHSMEEMQNRVPEAKHLVRCESSMASYITDSTGHHSVSIPFENPPAGQQFSTYIFKFACFGSCIGGPNRRPLMLIFTLERGNQVVGRRKLDVKICACPGRDKKTEESQFIEAGNIQNLPVKREEIGESVGSIPVKKAKVTSSGDYEIKVKSKECAEFLLNMRTLHNTSKTLENLSPDVLKTMIYYQKKCNEDGD